MANETFEQGWSARPFAQQFPELSKEGAEYLDRLNKAVTDLYLAGMLTDTDVNRIRQKRFPKVVSEEVGTARQQQGGTPE